MEYPFPPDVQQLIREAVAIGAYATEDDVLRDALHALIRGNKELAEIQAGVAELDAGRFRPLRDVDAEIRRDLGFSS